MTQYYIHYKFPNSTYCNVILLGYDGVFFSFPRDLNEFHNELLLSSGSRGDILIRCDIIGEFEVVALSLDGESQNNEEDFDLLERFGSGIDDHDIKYLYYRPQNFSYIYRSR